MNYFDDDIYYGHRNNPSGTTNSGSRNNSNTKPSVRPNEIKPILDNKPNTFTERKPTYHNKPEIKPYNKPEIRPNVIEYRNHESYTKPIYNNSQSYYSRQNNYTKPISNTLNQNTSLNKPTKRK